MLLTFRSYSMKERRKSGEKGRCRWNFSWKRKERRGGSKKREKHSKFKVSSLKSNMQPVTNHDSISYTQTHDSTVLTFMVAFTLRPLSRWAAVLLMSWLLIDFCVREARAEQRLGWWSRRRVRTSRRRGEKRCTSGPRVLLKTSRLFYVSFKKRSWPASKIQIFVTQANQALKWQTFPCYICIRYFIIIIQNRRGAFIGT